jgi:hypothetical protein
MVTGLVGCAHGAAEPVGQTETTSAKATANTQQERANKTARQKQVQQDIADLRVDRASRER